MRSQSSAFIGLGSNMGDRLQSLREAITRIAGTPGIVIGSVASLYESEPIGGSPGQARFFNSALRVKTSLEPLALMQALLNIESAMGRRRRQRWEDRVIDLDLLMYGDRVLETPELTLPHPRMHERLFVLEPLSELAADSKHPVIGRTIAQMADELRACSDQKLVRIQGPEWGGSVQID